MMTKAKGKGKAVKTPVAVSKEAAPAAPLKIAVVGCSDSKGLAPYNDPSWEIWAMNNAFGTQNPSRWFEIHPIKCTDGQYYRRKLIRPGVFTWSDEFRGQKMEAYIKSLAALNCPVYMQQHWDDIPKSIPYPLEEITQKFGRYFTNSVSYMIALAIMIGAKEIGCYGVDMSTGCLSPDVKVLRGDLKWVRADSLNVGDEVIGFDENSPNLGMGHSRKWRKAVVTSCPKFMKPCYRLKLEDGTEMIVSAGHGWLTNSENQHKWRRQEHLVTSHHRKDRPSRVIRVLDTWEQDNSWEAGYLAAAFDGEGHLSQKRKIQQNGYSDYTHGLVAGYSQKNNPMSETVEKIVEKYGFTMRMNLEASTGTKKYRINGGKPEILRFLGMAQPPRLMDKFDADLIGQFISKDNLAVVESEFIGDREVVGLETSTKTFIAEGLASHNSEYAPQRPSCEFFLGVAAGMGIKITVPDVADLLKTRFLYGFEEKEAVAWEKKMVNMMEAMEARKQKSLANHSLEEKRINQYVGAQEALKEIHRVWSNHFDSKIWSDPS